MESKQKNTTRNYFSSPACEIAQHHVSLLSQLYLSVEISDKLMTVTGMFCRTVNRRFSSCRVSFPLLIKALVSFS